MIRSTARSLWVCSLVLGLGLSTKIAWAQQPPPPTPPATTQPGADDDEARLDEAEPDFRLVALPTTMRLPKLKGNFSLTHRFNGDIAANSFTRNLETLFGMDEGAAIGLEYRIAPVRHVQAVIFRTNINREIQFSGRWDAVRQAGSNPVSITGIATIGGTNNFRDDYYPGVGVIVSSKMLEGHLALYAMPMWVHNTAAPSLDMDTTMIGLGARLRIHGRTYLVGEVTPRMSGYAPNEALYGFAIEKRVGGHTFQINFANGQATTFSQIAQGGFPGSLHLGFNLSRRFF